MGESKSVFEGERVNMDKLLIWCNNGPKNAVVEDIQIIDEEFKNEYSNFQIMMDA